MLKMPNFKLLFLVTLIILILSIGLASAQGLYEKSKSIKDNDDDNDEEIEGSDSSKETMPSLKIPKEDLDKIRHKFRSDDEDLISDEVEDILEDGKIPMDKTHRFVIERLCTPSFTFNLLEDIKTDDNNFQIIEVNVQDISKMAKDTCIGKFGDKHALEGFKKYIKNKVKEETTEKIREQKLEKSRGIEDIKEIEDIVTKEVEDDITQGEIVKDSDKISPYQYFVTPDVPEIKKLVSGKSIEEIYTFIASKAWMSDITLHGEKEKWLSPAEFLVSDQLASNPLNEIASDCSEHANTLASMLISSGVPRENVRVVLARVNFTGNVGGHAFVELLRNGIWLPLETTSGPRYDDESKTLIQRKFLPFDYFELHEYPEVERIAVYNDKYFWEPSGASNAPTSWSFESDDHVDVAFEELSPTTNLSPLTIILLVLFILVILKIRKPRRM